MIVLNRNLRGFIALGAVGLSISLAHAARAADASSPTQPPDPQSIAQASRNASILAQGKAAQQAQAAPSGQSASSLLLTVEEVDGTVKYGPTGAVYDLGMLTALDTGKIEHTFSLRNNNSGPVVIDRIPPTCGCTTVIVEGVKNPAFPLTVEPGNDIHIHTSIDRGQIDSGPFRKDVLVFLAGRSVPSHTLALIGRMRPAVALEPAMIEFGRIANTDNRVTIATVFYDPRLLAHGAKPQVSTTVQGVLVRESQGSSANPVAIGPDGPMDLPGYVKRNYEFEIPRRSRLGTIWGQIAVITKPALSQPTIGSVHAEVTGDISAQPSGIAFGSIAPNAITLQTLTIVGTTPEAVRNLRVDAPKPLLNITVNPVDPKAPATRTISVTLSPRLPPGPFQSYFTARSTNGDEIAVIVTAFVESPRELPSPVK